MADIAHGFGIGFFGEQRQCFAQILVFSLGDDELLVNVRPERLFHFLDLDFDATAAHHIVDASENTEFAITDLGAVVGREGGVAHMRRVNHKAATAVETHRHTIERRVPQTRFAAADAAQGNVRERFGHAVGAPYCVGEISQLTLQIIINCASTYNQVLDSHEPLALDSHL